MSLERSFSMPSRDELLRGLGVNDHDQEFWGRVSAEMRDVVCSAELIPMQTLEEINKTNKDA